MLKIECPYCLKLEEREFRQENKVVHHSIVCEECKLIERGRMTICNMITAINIILGSNRPLLGANGKAPLQLIRLRKLLNDAIVEIDLYTDEVTFI